MKHTPTPWQWFTNEAGQTYLGTPHSGRLVVMDFVRLGMNLAEPRFAVWDGEERGRMGGIMKRATVLDLATHPDAAMIVKAVNSFEAMREALQAAQKIMRAYIPADIYDGHAADAYHKVQAALEMSKVQ